jgi:replication factor A1
MSEMKVEAYINKIIEGTGLTRKEIQGMVEDKKKELKGLISEEGALFVIARELGVDVKEENKDLLQDIDLNIADITENMKNINITGRIKEIYSANKFNKADGGTGYVGSFLLHDKTGDIRIVLWDDNVNIFNEDNFAQNELVKIVNGIARKGKFEDIEIHIGRYGKTILSPDDIDYKKYPKVKFELMSINDINLNLKSISLEGKIIQKSPIKEFTRKNGEIGKVGSISLLDSTGSIRITFWNDDTEKLESLQINDVISISNLNPKLSSLDSKTIDMYASKYTTLKKIQKKMEIEVSLIQNIKKLQETKGVVSFKGKITSLDDLKEITSKSGEIISLLGFIISDDTDWIRVTLWRETAEDFSKKLSIGQGLTLKNVLLRFNNFSQRNEISTINDSTIELIDLDIENLKTIDFTKRSQDTFFSGNYVKIDSISSPGIVEIKGYIARDLTSITIYEACTNCMKKVDNCDCEVREKTEFRMIVNLIIDDGNGSIRTTFMGEKAEKLIGVETNKLVQIRETPDFEKFLEKKSSEFLGKDIVIKGKAKFSDYSSSFEISVFDFKYLDIDEELERAMKIIET